MSPDRSAYELVPSSEDSSEKYEAKHTQSLFKRKLKLIALSFVAILLLVGLYSFWSKDPRTPDPGDPDKSAPPKPAQSLPASEGDKGEQSEETMPHGKYSVG